VKADSALLSYASDTLAEARDLTSLHTLTTPRGGFYRLVLPDGSRLWLSAASSVTYPVAFAREERRVKVTGEVYFEVARDAARPFIVEAGAVSVEVLGTRFDIRAYADDGHVSTALVEGSVRIRTGTGGGTLRPGQMSVVDVRSGGHRVVEANLDQVLAWRNGEFYFDAADIGSIMHEVERWYDVTVRYPKGRPSGHYRGRPSRSLTLDQMLSVFEYSGLEYRIEGRDLLIYE
jgi:ferric-dicitrate binding protein FerR (iron transport regulator)